MYTESPLSGVNVVLVMAFGSLVFVLLFIFLQRQIILVVMKSHRRPHTPVGHNAPKALRETIESLLSEVYYSRRAPRLLAHDDIRLKQLELNGGYSYPYRMQALDAIKDAGIVSPSLTSSPITRTGSCYRKWLRVLRDSPSLIKSSLVERLLEGYDNARHGTGVFGQAELLQYKKDLAELAACVKVHSNTSSLDRQHRTATKALGSSSDQWSASTSQTGADLVYLGALKNSS